MRRSEVLPIAASCSLLSLALLFVVIKALPLKIVDDIDTKTYSMTPSMFRILSGALGASYSSLPEYRMLHDIESLPYIRNASFSYEAGTLLLNAENAEGAILVTPENAYFQTDDIRTEIPLEDTAVLSQIYPVIGVTDGELSEEEWAFLESALNELVSAPCDVRLISWIEYVNNIEDGLMELRIALPLLNTSILVKDPSALDRLDESIGIIEEENSSVPGRTVFSPSSLYELHSDRLIRIKG